MAEWTEAPLSPPVANAGRFLMSQLVLVGLEPTILWLGVRRANHSATLICCITARAHESQISLRFALWFLMLLVFQIIEVFDFSIGYNGEFAIFEKKSLKIRNSKFQKSQTQFCEDHWEENSGQVSKRLAAICRSSVSKFSLPLGPMSTKMNKIHQKFNFQNFKNPIHSFVRTIRKKIQE